MGDVVEELRELADVVLFDSPPVLVVADSAILSSRVDGVLLVNDAGNTRRNAAQRAVEELHRVRAHVLGVVLNRLVGRRDGYYHSTYNYYYYRRDDGSENGNHRGRSWLEEVLPFVSRRSNGSGD
jgi:non-specific protein-tyrosine kinase